MSDSGVRGWPIVETVDAARLHSHEEPALVPSPGHLVLAFLILQEKLFDLKADGDVARASSATSRMDQSVPRGRHARQEKHQGHRGA